MDNQNLNKPAFNFLEFYLKSSIRLHQFYKSLVKDRMRTRQKVAFFSFSFFLILIFCDIADAQTTYWFPGGITLLEQGRVNDFPDNVESRKWITSIVLTIKERCGDLPPPTLDLVGFSLRSSSYMMSAVPRAEEGIDDANALLNARGCRGIISIRDSALKVMDHYGGNDPDPEDFRKFVELASPQLLRSMGLSAETERQIKEAPVWWHDIVGIWVSTVDDADPNYGKITMKLFNSDNGRYAMFESDKGGGGLMHAKIFYSGQNVLFKRYPTSENYFVGKLSPDKKTINGELTVRWWHPKTREITFVKEN